MKTYEIILTIQAKSEQEAYEYLRQNFVIEPGFTRLKETIEDLTIERVDDGIFDDPIGDGEEDDD